MNLIIMTGIQASGKSTFCRERFADTHIILSLDMLRTRNREKILFEACLKSKQSVVIDNTNPTTVDRARYIQPAREAEFSITGYYVSSKIAEAMARNRKRKGSKCIPEKGILATYNKLQIPSLDEGFDQLHYVRLHEGEFIVDDWQVDEV